METFSNIHILLIDDDHSISERIKEKLTSQGWKVTHAPDGETGINRYSKEVYDVILLDCDMPDLKGLQVLEKIRTHQYNFPIIIFVEAGCENIAVQALKLDVDDYLIKDGQEVFLELIVPTVERTLKRKKHALENTQSKKALEESEERYRDIFENINDIVFSVDRDGIFTFVSANAERLYSYSPEDIIGNHFSDISHPDDYPALYKSFQDTLDGTIEPFEFRIFDGNGNKHYVQTSSRPVYKDGQVVGTTGVLRDITESKQKERELERITSDLTERVKELHCLYEISNIIENSDKLEDIYQGIIDIIPPSWQFPKFTFARITVEDVEYSSKPFLETKWRQSCDISVHGEIFGIIEVFVDGEQLDSDVEPFLKEEDDLLSSICERLSKTIQRVKSETTLLESQVLLARTQQIATVGSWVLEVAANQLTWSDETYRIFGLAPTEFAATYESFLDTVHPEDRAAVDDAYSESLREGTDTYEIEHRIVRADTGEIRHVYEKCFHERDRAGEIARSIGMVQDITDRVESDLRYAQILSTTMDGFWILDKEGNIIEANPAAAGMLGYTQNDMLRLTVSDIDANETPEEIRQHMKLMRENGYGIFETRHTRKDGGLLDVEVSFSYIKSDTEYMVVFVRDITDRKQSEHERETTVKLLSHLNERSDLHELASQLTHLMREWSGCEAVGIRLKLGEDYPYLETRGFPKEFVLAENSLCVTDEYGELLRDDTGNPLLECMCGNIIKGRYDSSLPFFTENGSFWTNSTTDLLGSTSEEDRQARTRNRCHGEGYESVALVPLHYGSESIGLLQFNDSRRDMFNEYMISSFERLATYIALGILERLSEEAVKESEKKYRDLVELSPYAIIIHIGGVFEYINNAGVKLIGATSTNQVIGKPVASFLIPAERDIAEKRRQRLFKEEGKSPPHEYKIISIDEAEKYVEVVSKKIDYLGEQAVLSIAHDITVRKMIEKRLAEAEKKWREILVNTPQIGISLDIKGRILFANQYFFKITDWREEEIIGKNWFDCCIPEKDRDEIKKIFCTIITQGEKTEFSNYENEILTKSGKRLYISWSNVITKDQKDTIQDVTCLGIDLTERKRAEEALRESEERMELALEGGDLGTWDWNIVTGEVFFNERWAEMLGYSLDEIKPHISTWEKLVHPDEISHIQKILNEHLVGTREYYETEHRLKHKSGYWIWVLDKGRVIAQDAQGKPLRACGTHLDITDRKRLEEQLFEAQKMEAIGTLTAGIAHDFNNILATIMGYSSFLKEKVRDKQDIFKGFDAIEKASMRASNLTSQLLAYTRKSMRDIKIIDINSVASEVTDLISKTFDKSITVRLVKGRGLPMIEGDESQIYQVIMNCAVNAQHAMPDGGLLKIETYTEKITEVIDKPHFTVEPGRYVTLKISDTGIGMNEETRSKIFEPYFTTRGNEGGSGLGMSVVFGIVKSHQGYIDLKSEPGRGTDVIISFLVSKDFEKELESEYMSKNSNEGIEKILIIDDEEWILEMERELLETSGYSVHTTSSPKKGVERARTMKPDLIILDLKMPEMDGFQVLQKLMTIDEDLKVLIASGFIETERKDDLIKMGAKGLIKKPFKADELKGKVREILGY